MPSQRTLPELASTGVRWDGIDSTGTTVADGRYSFSLESYDGDTLLGSDPGRVFTKVEEVRLVDGSPMLVVGGGAQVAVGDVSAVR